jgi:hypothetical protein
VDIIGMRDRQKDISRKLSASRFIKFKNVNKNNIYKLIIIEPIKINFLRKINFLEYILSINIKLVLSNTFIKIINVK